MTVALFSVGFLALLAQVVLLRELSVAFYGIELAYLVALAAWMAGTAAGAWIGVVATLSRAGAAAKLPRTGVAVLALAALLVPLDVAFVRGSRILFGGVPGAYLPIERQTLALLLAIAPIAALFGLAFTLAARTASAGGRLAAAYAVECAGAAAAGLAATVAFKLGAQNFAMAIAVAAVGLATGAGLVRRSSVGPVIVAVGLVAAWQSGPLDARLTRWTHPTLAETRDTPYARITLTRAGTQVAVFENDVLAHDSESVANEELPHLAALQRPTQSRILLLGGAVELMDVALARHGPRFLQHVEIDGAMVDAARRLLPLVGRPEIADPRSVLSGSREYDLIVVGASAPVSGQSNRFYTREFFDACARRLAPGGVLALRLDVPQNYLGPAALLRAASVARALRGAFSQVEFLPATRTVALASDTPLPSPDIVCARITERRLQTQLVTPAYVRYLYANDRREELRSAFATTTAPENRDGQPIAYLFAAASWLSKFWPGLIGADWARAGNWRSWPAAWRWGIPVAILLALAASRLRPGSRRAALAFVAGLAGMMLETIVLLHYQATQGALFEDLGLLMMAFMAGTAVGSWYAGSRHPALPLVALVAWGAISWWVLSWTTAFGLVAAGVMLAGIGVTVGALFAVAGDRLTDGGAAGRLYGADVLGGCAGSLAASLFLIPLAGMDATALIVSALATASLVLAWPLRTRR